MSNNAENQPDFSGRKISRRGFLKGAGAVVATGGLAVLGVDCAPDGSPKVTSTPTLPVEGHTGEIAKDGQKSPTVTVTEGPTATSTPESRYAPDSLRELASSKGIEIGTEINSYAFNDSFAPPGTENAPLHFLPSEFNLATLSGLNWGRRDQYAQQFPGIRPTKDTFDFSNVDGILNTSSANEMSVAGQHLIWGNPTFLPDWLVNGNFSPDELRKQVEFHISGVMTHIREKAGDNTVNWSVVNEYFPNPNTNFWYANLGEDLVDFAFQTARKADPKAKLFLNNGLGNEVIGSTSNMDYERVKRLKGKGLIDAYGMQMHLDGINPPEVEVVATNVKRFKDLGVDVDWTEFDVDMSKVGGTVEERQAKEAQIYGDMVKTGLNSGVRSISFFGMNDRVSWLGKGADGTMFDEHYNPKPAFAAVQTDLKNFTS